ncbi:MAG: tRNA pseudouridine(38-40) synthase TruA [Clostridiales bacterium]|nr:tRNA pseudouridine(38-40) synthase TruA [Clostridiales bacterium]
MKYKITLSYDGTPFCGWQSQPSGNSIQDAVETAVYKLCGEKTRVTGSGRTDAGVHAVAQVAHFSVEKELPLKTVVGGLNAYLPAEVRVLTAEYADEEFDARKSVKKKTYLYLYYTGAPLPVLNGRVYNRTSLDEKRMDKAARELIGKHDFKCFMASGSGAKTTVRTVHEVRVERHGDFVGFYITADGFLYNMVRIIAAQLTRIGSGEDISLTELIEKGDRTLCKDTAPACGLYLYSVEYV